MGADPLIPADPDRPVDPPPSGEDAPADVSGRGPVRERAEQVRDRTRERAEQVRDKTRERTEQLRERTEPIRDKTREQTERVRMTVYRLFGIDRSGPPPPQTLPGQPLNVWTLPNAVGMIRLALIPVFLVLALSSDGGTDALPAVLFAFIAGTDYLDGFLARATGQYSRFGALLDPVTDRSLVMAGGVVCWSFELLPRWALAILVARELYVLYNGRKAVRLGLGMQVNWWGRIAVVPTMGSLFLALVGLNALAEVLLYVGVTLSLMAAARYTVQGRRALRERREGTTT
ncbi:CDP-diacylglycerol--glycerol-3-phosphate 3-phosphatidyltransferase [Patulibacter medicamentivorans]|uniref:CDP-diacylglycerol--glycerol-3-phosphate 3-phosphatidyltransferase n=1 Tax=Patulibacter medicamentivorans TaxID=1097667 RepID=H0EBE9_9ACTN|nr:CDP-diacylglycerol--glycerol-3-phosphate 3-phosphatidyltransferase [Patulibacter medicamentivorans]